MNPQLVLTIIGAVSTLMGEISHFINPEVSPPFTSIGGCRFTCCHSTVYC